MYRYIVIAETAGRAGEAQSLQNAAVYTIEVARDRKVAGQNTKDVDFPLPGRASVRDHPAVVRPGRVRPRGRSEQLSGP